MYISEFTLQVLCLMAAIGVTLRVALYVLIERVRGA